MSLFHQNNLIDWRLSMTINKTVERMSIEQMFEDKNGYVNPDNLELKSLVVRKGELAGMLGEFVADEYTFTSNLGDVSIIYFDLNRAYVFFMDNGDENSANLIKEALRMSREYHGK